MKLKKFNDFLNEDSKKVEYRITDGENPKKVILSIINRIKNPNRELIRLKNKISKFDM